MLTIKTQVIFSTTLLLATITIFTTSCKKESQLTSFPENCIQFDPKETTVENINGWVISHKGAILLTFKEEQEAHQAQEMMLAYGMNKQCQLGNPEYEYGNDYERTGDGMYYYYENDQAPVGQRFEEEDCLKFDPEKIKAKKVDGNWTVVEPMGVIGGLHLMFNFGNDEQACRNAVRIIKENGFDLSCFIGRPTPSMQYLAKSSLVNGPKYTREDIQPSGSANNTNAPTKASND